MIYGEIAPHPLLRPFVRTCWWLRGPSADAVPQPVMPDGTTELIVHRGRPFWRYVAQGAGAFDCAQAGPFDSAQAGPSTSLGPGERQSPFLFAGQMRAPAIIQPDGEADVVSIRFAPHGAFALLGVPQSAVADHICDAASLGLAWLSAAMRESQSAETPEEAIRRLELALIQRVLSRRRAADSDAQLAAAVALIDKASGAVTIDAVAARVGTGRRQLERLFAHRVGLTPKGYARVVRFQAAASRLAAEPVAPLADVSAGAGYFDQSHMIREFLTLAGRSPAEFRRHLSGLTEMMLTRG